MLAHRPPPRRTRASQVMPHFPARGIASRAELDARIAAYADVGVRQALVIAGGIDTPARPVRRVDAAAGDRRLRRLRLHRPARRRPPGGQPRHRPGRRRGERHGGARAAKDAFQRETDAAMAIATQFAFEAAPVIAWAERLRAAGITLPVHIGVAGPAKLQTMLKFAMACGVGPSLARAAAPRRRPDEADAALRADRDPGRARRATRRRIPDFAVDARASVPARRHRAPPPTTPGAAARAAAGRGHDAAALLFDLDGTLVDTDHLHHAAFVAILAERGETLSLADYRTHIMGQPNEAIMARYFPGRGRARAPSPSARRRCSAPASPRSVGAGRRHPRAARLGRGRAAPAAPSSPTRPRDNAEAMLAAAGLAERLADAGDRRRVRPPEARPRCPTATAMRRARRHARRARSPSRTPAPACAPPAPSGAHVFGLATGLTAGRAAAGRRAPGDRRLHRPRALGASRPAEGPRRMTRTIVESKIQDRHHRLRPAVLRDRRAHQPHRPQEARRRARGGRLLHRRARRAASRWPAAPACST